jgi:hypothetical protein
MVNLAKATMYTLRPKLDWLDVLISLNGLLLVILNFLQPLFLFMGGDWDVKKYCCKAKCQVWVKLFLGSHFNLMIMK